MASSVALGGDQPFELSPKLGLLALSAFAILFVLNTGPDKIISSRAIQIMRFGGF